MGGGGAVLAAKVFFPPLSRSHFDWSITKTLGNSPQNISIKVLTFSPP